MQMDGFAHKIMSDSCFVVVRIACDTRIDIIKIIKKYKKYTINM